MNPSLQMLRRHLRFATIALALSCVASVASAAIIADWRFNSQADIGKDSFGGWELSSTDVIWSSDAPNVVGTPLLGSAVFNGTSSSMSLVVGTFNLNSWDIEELTIEFFYKKNGAFSSSAEVICENSGGVEWWNDSGAFMLAGGGYQVTGGANGGGGYAVDTATVPVDNTWHHFAMEINTLSTTQTGYLTMFLDGQQVGTVDPLTDAGPLGDYQFWLGSRAGTSLFFAGQLAGFRISDTLLAPSEFEQFAAVPEPSSVVLLVLGGLVVFRLRRGFGGSGRSDRQLHGD